MTKKVKAEAESILKPAEKKAKVAPSPAETKLDKEIKAADAKIKKMKDAKPVEARDPGLATESKELVAEAKERARDKELDVKKEEIKQLEKDEKADKLAAK
jgi:hypothetical protein